MRKTVMNTARRLNTGWPFALSLTAFSISMFTAAVYGSDRLYAVICDGRPHYDLAYADDLARLSTITPFQFTDGLAIAATTLGIITWSISRGARPNPPSVHLHADPLQEAMDGAHRVYVYK